MAPRGFDRRKLTHYPAPELESTRGKLLGRRTSLRADGGQACSWRIDADSCFAHRRRLTAPTTACVNPAPFTSLSLP